MPTRTPSSTSASPPPPASQHGNFLAKASPQPQRLGTSPSADQVRELYQVGPRASEDTHMLTHPELHAKPAANATTDIASAIPTTAIRPAGQRAAFTKARSDAAVPQRCNCIAAANGQSDLCHAWPPPSAKDSTPGGGYPAIWPFR